MTFNLDCKTCLHEQAHGPLDYTKSNPELARAVGCGEASIRRHRNHRETPKNDTELTNLFTPNDDITGHADINADGGEFQNIKSDKPITDWTHVFEQFKLDPAEFSIIGDTVRMSTWQQSKALEDGTRDIVQLYSYRAQFRRITEHGITTADIETARENARNWTIRRTPGAGIGEPVAAVLNLADMQLMKSEGGGVTATLDRVYGALEKFAASIEAHRRTKNINELVITNMGDPFEGIAGNYASQTFTVQGGLRAQMNLVLDVWSTFARELFPRFDKAQFVSVLCNHTEFGRQGGAKNSITSDSDNGGAFLAETLQRITTANPALDHVQYVIPHDEMNVYTTAAGVPIGLNHGHKIPGADAAGFEKWLNGQVRYDPQAANARIWVTAHRHNFQAWDLGSTFAFSCPSCDGGSKWLTDTTGKHSRSGVLSFLVGEHHPLGWSDVAFH